MTKYCKFCNKEKKLSDFSKNGKYRHSKCKICVNAYYKKYAENIENIKKIKNYGKLYRANNVEKLKAKRKKYKKRKNELEKSRYHKKYKKDIIFTLRLCIRRRFSSAIRNNLKTGSAIKSLGCDIDFLKKHLESKFKPGMSWENYGQWHIDHIKPLSSFNLLDKKELLKACNYKNLQPLWAQENLKKGSKDV